MNHYDVVRFALILSIQAEVEGMKVADKERCIKQGDMQYDQSAYEAKADELRNIAHCNDDQL